MTQGAETGRDDLAPLRAALEGFIRDACTLIASDDRLFMVRQAPWVQIKGSVGPTGGSFSLDTITRPQPILTTPATHRVMALGATAPVIEQLHALPAWIDLLPPPAHRSGDFEENDYLRKTFAVDF